LLAKVAPSHRASDALRQPYLPCLATSLSSPLRSTLRNFNRPADRRIRDDAKRCDDRPSILRASAVVEAPPIQSWPLTHAGATRPQRRSRTHRAASSHVMHRLPKSRLVPTHRHLTIEVSSRTGPASCLPTQDARRNLRPPFCFEPIGDQPPGDE
jgi:hypothetical protein